MSVSVPILTIYGGSEILSSECDPFLAHCVVGWPHPVRSIELMGAARMGSIFGKKDCYGNSNRTFVDPCIYPEYELGDCEIQWHMVQKHISSLSKVLLENLGEDLAGFLHVLVLCVS